MLSAILPFGLHDLIRVLPDIASRLDALDDDKRIRQVQRFRDRFYPDIGGTAPATC
jgi:hypothetical protein